MVRATQHPPADLRRWQRAHQVYGNSLAIGHGQLRRCSPALRQRIPKTDQVISLVLDEIQIERDDFAYYAAKTFQVRRLPLAKMRNLFLAQVFLFIFGGIINAMPQLLTQKRRQFAAPQPTAVFRIFDGTAQVGKHGAWAGETLACTGGTRQTERARYSDRSACCTSIRAARAAGRTDATTAAASSTNADATTGRTLGIRRSVT